MTESHPQPFLVRCGEMTLREYRAMVVMMTTLAFWAICYVGSSQLIKRGVLTEGPLAWAMATLPSIAGVLVLFAYARFLRACDELQRLIQLQALALGFGGTFFAIAGYRVFERLGAPVAEASDYSLVMSVLYTLGVVLGWRRYR